MLSHRETKVGSDSDLKSRGPVQTQQNFPTSTVEVCPWRAYCRPGTPPRIYLPFGQSKKWAQDACSESEETARDSS